VTAECPASEVPVTAAKPLIGNDPGKATGSVCFSVGFCHHRKGLPVGQRKQLPEVGAGLDILGRPLDFPSTPSAVTARRLAVTVTAL
jgi:hypothetical protein